ncbi:hypothetical protein F3J38_21605 [Pantoea sp. Acro-805]|uniref:Uncharacterized protein n=1 Tax=Candidatus Pantoea formicae TaxID=2608355 RepID=A0ABX0R058_9GAMM|nr:hypothetical protein [Pantoea formicae]NIF02612.1 hypothetical protein [Pantoea formicae]
MKKARVADIVPFSQLFIRLLISLIIGASAAYKHNMPEISSAHEKEGNKIMTLRDVHPDIIPIIPQIYDVLYFSIPSE